MKEETLEKANKINSEIIKKRTLISALENQRKAVVSVSSNKIRINFEQDIYPMNNKPYPTNIKVERIIEKKYILKSIDHQLYIEKNLLKRSELQFKNL